MDYGDGLEFCRPKQVQEVMIWARGFGRTPLVSVSAEYLQHCGSDLGFNFGALAMLHECFCSLGFRV